MNPLQKNAFIYSTIVAMGGFVFGLDAALISGTINFITQEFSLTDLQLGTAVSASALGVLIALPFAGYASNMLGRKKTLQVIAALYLVSAIGSALAPSYWLLVSARFIGGLAFSSITLSTMYIGEIAPPDLRGKLVSMNQINIVVGLSAAYYINYLILGAANSGSGWAESMGLGEHTWRWMLGSEVIPALCWLILLSFIPKSPSWLIYKGRNEEAAKVLAKVLSPEKINDHIYEKEESLKSSINDRSILNQLKEIFSKPMRITFVVAITIAIAQQATGINAILFYAPTVFEQLGIGTDAAFQQATWIGIISIIFTLLGLMLVDKVGRRPMIIWGMVWIIASLSVSAFSFYQAHYSLTEEAITELSDIAEVGKLQALTGQEYGSDIEFKQAVKDVLGEEQAREYESILLQKAVSMNAGLVLFGILSFIAAFQFSVGPIMWVLFSEIFPIAIRGTAIPFFALITSLTSYLVQQFFPLQLSSMGISSILLFYATTVAIGLAILYRFLPETKNLTIEEIQAAMMSGKTHSADSE